MSYLERHVDPAVPVRADDKPDTVQAAEVERLTRMYLVCQVAASHPRRLGADATSDDLARDKRQAKRIGHVMAQCLRGWGIESPKNAASEDVRQAAAQMEWKRWWHDHNLWLRSRITYVATWATKRGVDSRWAKSALVRLENELRWLEYAMRDG